MKKVMVTFLTLILFLSLSLTVANATVPWGKVNYKEGAIGKVIILKETYTYVLKNGKYEPINKVLKGQEFLVYNKKDNYYKLSGNQYIKSNNSIKYQKVPEVIELRYQVQKLTNEVNKLKKELSTKWSVPSNITGKWAGTYTASQGETKLTLTFKSNNIVEFKFEPTKNNPNVSTGTFIMKKKFNKTTGYIYMDGLRWTQDPGGYNMVDLEGSYSGNYINGTVLNQDGNSKLGSFSVKKIK